jgi:hypothetical protein
MKFSIIRKKIKTKKARSLSDFFSFSGGEGGTLILPNYQHFTTVGIKSVFFYFFVKYFFVK